LKKRALQQRDLITQILKQAIKTGLSRNSFLLLKLVHFLFIFSGLLFISACEIYDPVQKIPAYIQVDSFSFSTNDKTGFNTQKIKEVWIFVNGQQIGTYSVPTKAIPALAEGNSTISISAGVSADGIVGNKVLYPFYGQYIETRNLEKGKVSKFIPKFHYDTNLKKPFIYYQDFEISDSGVSKGNTGTVDLKLETHLPSAAYDAYGNKFGKITTLTKDDILEFTNDIWVRLNEVGMPIYLEFDYKTTTEVQVGILGKLNNQGNSLASADLVLKPTETWTKIYVNLTDEVGLFRPERGYFYRFFIRTRNAPGAGNSISIDNIRLINFPEP